MEYSMRDLDRLQEQDPDERGRQLGIWIVLATTLFALFGAVFLVWSRATRPKVDRADPLDRLGVVQGAATRTRPKSDVDPTKLTFERSLTGEEERPEVIAALAAAAREEQELAAAQQGRSNQRPASDDTSAPEDKGKDLPMPSGHAQIPAGLTASSGTKLEKAARHDKLVAAALPKGHGTHTRASTGSDGEFVLQVISYDTKDEAEAFASALRDRGHEAFVAAGHVDGRNRTYRVRIGPFKSKAAAEAYRHDFDERERMNTIIVRHRDDD